MSSIEQYKHLVFPQKLFVGDYLFFYASDYNTAVVLIQPTPDISDTPEAEMLDEEVVDTMVDGMMEAMECKNGKILFRYLVIFPGLLTGEI